MRVFPRATMQNQDLFYQGRYQELLAGTIDSKAGTLADDDLPFVIGALTFRGRMSEAQHLFDVHRSRFCPVSIFLARFFLGVGYCRRSGYKESVKLFAENLRAGAKSTNPIVRFFAWQGVALYRLFCGRYRRSFEAARKALAAALEGNFLYGKVLASDVLAHSQVFPGHVSAAMRSFSEARSYAKLLGDGGILQAVETAQLIHSAMFGLNPEGDLAKLEELCAGHSEEDDYSKSRLLMEFGRLKTLRGDVRGAWAAFNAASRMVYASNNRRYSILINLHFAYLLHLQGEQHQALNLVRNAEKELDARVDRSLGFAVLGLEKRICLAMDDKGIFKCPKFQEQRYAGLTTQQERSGKAINQRIVDRSRNVFQSHRFLGDDPLGDLIDLCFTNREDAALKIADTGFYGLFLQLIPNALGKKVLYFDLVPGSIVVLNKGNVDYLMNNASSVIRSIAKELIQGEVSKQELIERVWGYKYAPLRHDSLVYRSISRFRQMLGANASWLEATATGYRLAPDVSVQFHRSETVIVPRGPTVIPEPTVTDGMNYRQVKILERLQTDDFINVKVCQTLFDVSEITARRDLAELYRVSLVQRIGKGRATQYRLSQSV